MGKWLASGLNEDKLRAAMQRPDFQQTFIRLAVADKGLNVRAEKPAPLARATPLDAGRGEAQHGCVRAFA